MSDEDEKGLLYEVKVWDELGGTYRSLGLYWFAEEDIKIAVEDRIMEENTEYDKRPELFKIGEMSMEEAMRYADQHLKVLLIYTDISGVKKGDSTLYWPKYKEDD